MKVTIKNCGPFLLLLIFLNILSWIAVFSLKKAQFLEVTFFDVGQGDAVFIKTPRGHQILIDGGPTPQVLEKLNQEMPFWDRSIDLIILTHPEHDHLAGLIEVLKMYKIENILWTGVARDIAEVKEWLKQIEGEKNKEGAEIKIAQSGQKIKWSSSAPKEFIEILYPFESLAGRKLEDTNNASIVAKLTFGKNSFLFTGDIYKSAEAKLIISGSDLDSDVLKISHHGSKTSSSEEFIKEVSPEIAVISVGKDNSYGQPHQEVLEILSKAGIKTLRTDLNDDIKIISDRENLMIEQ